MKIQLFLAISCFYASAPAFATTSGSGPSYDTLVSVGRTYCDRGESEKAHSPLNQAIKREPARPEAYVVLGFVYAVKGDYPASITAYEKARSRGTTERRLFVELATLYDVEKKYPQAVAVYRDYLAKNPADWDLRHELGLTLILSERFPEAITELKAVHKKFPKKIVPKRDLAYAYARSGEHPLARPLLEQAFPTTMPLKVLVDFVQTYSDPKAALHFFNRYAALPLDPAHERIKAHLQKLAAP